MIRSYIITYMCQRYAPPFPIKYNHQTSLPASLPLRSERRRHYMRLLGRKHVLVALTHARLVPEAISRWQSELWMSA